MVLTPAKIDKIQSEFALLASQASEASSQLERGQAESPLTEAFRNLIDSADRKMLIISLLCLDVRSKNFLLRWLAGAEADLAAFSENDKKLSQIHVNLASDRSSANGDVTSATSVSENEIDVDGHNCDMWQNVTFMLASDIEQLRNQPQLYQQFCTTGHVLMVAGDLEQTIADRDIELIGNLAGAFEVIWLTVLSNKQEATTDGWWNHMLFHSHMGRIAPLFLHSEATSGGGEILSQPKGTLRTSLLFERIVRRLGGAVGNLSDRQERELKSIKVRQSLLEDQSKPVARRSAPTGDKLAVQVREHVTVEIASLEKAINLKSERATQPLGKLTNLMREIVSKLGLEDLDKQQSPSLIKLSINGSHLGAVNRTIEHALRQELTTDVKAIQQRLANMTTHSAQELVDVVGDEVSLEAPPLVETEIWRNVENLMAIGKESHIELARKGFFDVLTAGRQKVFILIMFVSLMGRMGLPNLFATGLMRTGFGLFMASVLISSMVNAIFVWRREKESQSEKEMSKIKDSLFSDGAKVIEQVEKGKLMFIRDYLKDFSKKFDQQLKRSAEQYATQSKADFDAETKRYEANRKLLEAQIKSITEVGKQIDKLSDGTKRLHATTTSLIRDAARQHETISPDAPDSDNLQQSEETAGQADIEQSENASLDSDGNARDAPARIPIMEEATSDLPAEEQVEPAAPEPDERQAHRPSALLQRREARRLARLAQQANTVSG